MEDTDQNIHLRNLSLQQAANEEEALNLLFLGDTNRMISEVRRMNSRTVLHSSGLLEFWRSIRLQNSWKVNFHFYDFLPHIHHYVVTTHAHSQVVTY